MYLKHDLAAPGFTGDDGDAQRDVDSGREVPREELRARRGVAKDQRPRREPWGVPAVAMSRPLTAYASSHVT
jgi:hypothetical protein